MPAATTDFQRAAGVLSGIMGRAVEVRDNPKAGEIGRLDPKDHYLKQIRRGRARKVRLGKKRFDDLALRMNVIKAA